MWERGAHCGLCRSLKHRTRDCEERGVEKGAMLAKINVPANSEVGLVAETIGTACGDGKDEWDSDVGVSFHMFHTQAIMSAYKKAPAGTTVEVADGTISPVDGFGTVEVDLDQPGTTTKPVKMISVTYLPGLSQNLLSTCKVVEQWCKPLVYYRTIAVSGFPGEESLVLNFCPSQQLFSATDARQTSSQEAALGLVAKTAEAMRVEATGRWGPCADMRRSPRRGAALVVAAKAHDTVEVHRVLAHPSEEITQKTVQTMRIATTSQRGPCEARLQVKTKRQAVQYIDGSGKTGRNCVGDEYLDLKPGEDESVRRRGALQLDVQELEPLSQEHKQDYMRHRRIPTRRHGRRNRIARKRFRRYHRTPDNCVAGSQAGDTGIAIGLRGRDTGGTIGSRGGDT